MEPAAPNAEALRAALVETLRTRGRLQSPAIAVAFALVPRHLFVPDVSLEEAYRDTFIATKRQPDGEVISSSSQPEIMAIMLEQLDLRPGQRVLEIGAGTGYNAALLARVVGDGGRVTTLDLDDDIVAGARAHLAAAGVTGVRVVCADGWAGCVETAPFDRIILTVGAHDISPTWRAQLAPGGRLVLPLGLLAVQASVAFAERDGILESVSVRPCQFMRLRGSAAVPMRPEPVGPAPAPGVWLRAGHAMDGAAVHALLQAPARTLATGLSAQGRELYAGLIAWVGLHEPTSGWFVAQGEARAAGLVPSFVGDGVEAMATYGLFEPGGVALFVRLEPPPDADGGIAIGVRVHGEATVGERLLATTLAWSEAGRPDIERLRIRAYPTEAPCEPQPQEIVLTRRARASSSSGRRRQLVGTDGSVKWALIAPGLGQSGSRSRPRDVAQTSPRNYPGSCSQREPKRPKRDDVRNANLRGVVCGALAPVSIWEGLIIHCTGFKGACGDQAKREVTTRIGFRTQRPVLLGMKP